jgi:hypothetical protein
MENKSAGVVTNTYLRNIHCSDCGKRLHESFLFLRNIPDKKPVEMEVAELCDMCYIAAVCNKRATSSKTQTVIDEKGNTIVVKKQRKKRDIDARPYVLDIELSEQTTEQLRKLRHHLYARKSAAKDEAIKKELYEKIHALKAELIKRKEFHGKEAKREVKKKISKVNSKKQK